MRGQRSSGPGGEAAPAYGAPARPAGRRSWWPVLILAAFAAGCGPERPPPAGLMFDGLPVSGSMALARRAGFTDCAAFDAASLRCRRHGVMVEGAGPFEAAVDLVGSDGSGGFDEVTLWHDTDQYAVYAVAEALARHGWHDCNTGDTNWGDQAIYTRPGGGVLASMDLSYWSKRRIRFIPAWNRRGRRC